MPAVRRAVLILAPVAALVAALLVLAAPAGATTWGQQLRFEGKGTGEKKGTNFLFSETATHVFGVDTKENGVFVGDELHEGEHEGEKFQIQKYDGATGHWEGHVVISLPEVTGTNSEPVSRQIEGAAVDPEKGIVYVLGVYERSGTVDPSLPAAGTLYAFNTEPVEKENPKTKKIESLLVPAPKANAEGVLASLEAGSETLGKALLEPRGLAVDPKTHQVLILGQLDAKGNPEEIQTALARISEAGAPESPWVDPKSIGEEELPEAYDSPVVSTNGTVFFQQANAIMATKMESAPPAPVFQLGLKPAQGPFTQELVAFDEPEGIKGGAQLAIAPSSNPNEGTLFTTSLTAALTPVGGNGGAINTTLAVGYEDGGPVKTKELGWVGGISSQEPGTCVLEFGVTSPLIAGGKDGEAYDLTSRPPVKQEDPEGVVVKLGPGGSGKCPAAKSASPPSEPIEATFEGSKLVEIEPNHTVTLSTKVTGENEKVSGASVLSTEWVIGGEKVTVPAPLGETTQTAQIEHKFTVGGEVKVEATIHTDDLAGPETITVSGTLHVKFPIEQPKELTVTEGETATFKSSAPGATSEQWEVSRSPGAWEEIPGATSTTYATPPTTHTDNGFLYRATFKNGKAEAKSAAARLNVIPVAPPAVTQQPASQTVEEGRTASFTATASGAPTPTVQWEFSTNGGSTFTAVPGATSNTLSVVSTTLSESGFKYRAVFSNTNPVTKEVKTVTSNAATLTVNKKPPPPPPPPPVENHEPPPTTTTTGSGGVKPFVESSPSATIAGTSITVTTSGSLTIKVSCPPNATCTGTVTLKTLAAVAARAHAAKTKKAILTLAQGSFTVTGGSTKSVTLHLSSKARKLLARVKTVRAKATVAARNNAGATATSSSVLTLKLEKKKKHH